MRALLSTIGSRGDVQPLVALALQLRALGHDARLCVPPDFSDWIEGLGFSVAPIGPRVRTFAGSSTSTPPVPPTADERRQMIEATVATQFATIAAATHECDVIVAATALQVAARSIAEDRSHPYVFVAYSPNVVPSAHHAPAPLPPVPGQPPPPPTTDNRELWAQSAARFNDTFGVALNAHRRTLGLPAVSDVRGYMLTERPWLAADATLAPWPDPADGAVFQTGAWILDDDRPLARDVDTFLDSGEPPVYLGFGSMRAPGDLGQAMLDAARAVGRRAILSRGWADLSLDETQPDCLVVGEANLQALFPRVAAIVHHGGAGTTTLAARAGVPQVVVPQMYDQHYWGRQIEGLAIGVAHARGIPTRDSLTAALQRALTTEVANRARSIAGKIRGDGARAAALHIATADV